MKVHEVMTTAVVTTKPNVSLKDAALVLAQKRISGMPVVGDDGAILGVLSEADILAKETTTEAGRRGFMHWLLDPTDPWIESRFSAVTVGEAMSAPAEVIGPDSDLAEAATRMLEGAINRLPVVGADGKLVGLVSRGDLVRAFARSDEEILHEIEQILLRETLWIDHPEDVHVAVVDGVVTLSGKVESAADAELLPLHVRRVPGVVAVTTKLTARDGGEERIRVGA